MSLSLLDMVLSSLGLPGCFRHAYFEDHSHVRLRFKLAAGMMFITALYLPWCRYLAAQPGVQPQLCADNL